MLVRSFATISLLGGLGVQDHQNGLWQIQILLNVVYFVWLKLGYSIDENPIIAQMSYYQKPEKRFCRTQSISQNASDQTAR